MPLEEKGSLCSLEVSHPSTSPVPPFTPFLSDLAIQECRDLLPGPPSVTKCEPRPEQVPVLGSILREGHFLWSLLFLPKGWHATNTSSFPHALSPMVTEDLDLGGQLAPKNVMTRQGCSTKRPRTWRRLGAGYRWVSREECRHTPALWAGHPGPLTEGACSDLGVRSLIRLSTLQSPFEVSKAPSCLHSPYAYLFFFP